MKTKGSCIFMLFRYELCSICLVSWCSCKCFLIFSKVTEVEVGIGNIRSFTNKGKHTLPRLLGLLRGNNRYLLYFYKETSLGAVHLKYITVYLLIKVSNLRSHRVEYIFLTSHNLRKNYSFENHVKYFEIAISGKSAPFGFIQS